MPPVSDQLDLNHLGLKPGGGMRFETAVRVGDFIFSGQRYSLTADPLLVLIDASRTTSGYVVRVRAKPEVTGPCMRCSDDFALPLKIDHSEVHEPGVDSELASEYVEDGKLDLAAVVHDAVGLALPPSISGRLDDSGDCTACDRTHDQLLLLGVTGEDQVAGEDAGGGEHQPDPRWAKLRELEL